jgi:hypothetical protein
MPRMAEQLHVTVWFSDGHRERWKLPEAQTADEAYEELRRVIASGQWFRPPDSAKAYSPYAIVAVSVAPESANEEASVARRLGEAVGEAISSDKSG